MSQFDYLVEELEALQENAPLAKGFSATEESDYEDEYQDFDLNKSMPMTLPNGEEAYAIDGDVLMKSFEDMLDTRIEENNEGLEKAIGGLVALVKTQLAAISSLQKANSDLHGKFELFAKSGSGRKSTFEAESKQPPEFSQRDFMAKAEVLMKSHQITSREFQVADAAIRNKTELDPALVAKVLNA